MTVKECLTAARGLIDEPRKWAKDAMAINSSGLNCGCMDPDATAFNVSGAIQRAAKEDFDVYLRSCFALEEQIGGAWEDADDWVENAKPDHAEVLAVFDKALMVVPE